MKMHVGLSKYPSSYRDLIFPFVCLTGGKEIEIPVNFSELGERLEGVARPEVEDKGVGLCFICEWLAEMTVVRFSIDRAENGLPDNIRAAIQKAGFVFRNLERSLLEKYPSWDLI